MSPRPRVYDVHVTRIFSTALLVFAVSLVAQNQTAPKPEDGFVSAGWYTNRFFGFSLPLPQDANLRPLATNGPTTNPYRHALFGASSVEKGYPVIVILADEISGADADSRKAVLALGAHKVDVTQMGGKEFSRGRWRADSIYRVVYATALRDYMLYISVFTYHKDVLDEFERNIQQITFFDPATAQQQPGPDSHPYVGPTPPAPVSSQQSTNSDAKVPAPSAGTQLKSSDVTDLSAGRFYAKDLDLHFNYPVEMQALDAQSEIERGHLKIYGAPGESDPEHQEVKRCLRPLLYADLPQAKAPQRGADVGGIWVHDAKQNQEPRKPEPIFAEILLAETVHDCLPQELQGNEGDALRAIALSFVSEPGIQRMPKPLWYDLGKQKIHMNAGVGRLIINGQLAPAPIIVMTMATQWRGHLLAWVFASNDAEVFNEITKSAVQFGNGSWVPMFAANIGPNGSGTPMTILPK